MWRISVGSFSGRIYITSVNIYLWIACKIVYSVNEFLGIAYGVNQFLGIGVCIIPDCWLDGKSLELFHNFCINDWSNSSLNCHVCIFPLCIDRGGWLKQSIYSNVINVTFGMFSSSSMTLITTYWIFLLDNGVPRRSLWLSRESNISV